MSDTGPHIPDARRCQPGEILAMGGYTWEQVHAMDKSGAIAAMTESISKMLLKTRRGRKRLTA